MSWFMAFISYPQRHLKSTEHTMQITIPCIKFCSIIVNKMNFVYYSLKYVEMKTYFQASEYLWREVEISIEHCNSQRHRLLCEMHRNHSIPYEKLRVPGGSWLILFLLLLSHCTARGLGRFLSIAILGQSANGKNPSEPFQGYLSGQNRVMPNMVSAKSMILLCLALVLFSSEWPKARSL